MLPHRLKMDETAVYRICFQGGLDESWRHYLGAGWTIQSDDHEPESTTITGVMRDQAELIGLLSSLYDVGLPLLAVEYLETDGGGL
jgi:hypothetical protein